MVELAPHFDELVESGRVPEQPLERYAFASMCLDRGQPDIAAELLPDLVEDPVAGSAWGLRARAAQAVLLAGEKPGAANRSDALQWLRADFDDYRQASRASSVLMPVDMVFAALLVSPAYRSVRDASALAALPARERELWQAFWDDVRQMLDDSLRKQNK